MKSKVKITGKGKLWDVDFIYKGSKPKKLKFTLSSDGTKWESEEFRHGNPIFYELVVHARRGTGWEGSIEDINNGQKYIEWKLSQTNKQHESKRSQPNKLKLV